MHAKQPIRSFVRRDSRITPAQRNALEQHWQRFALEKCVGREDLNGAFRRSVPVNIEIGSGDGICVLQLATSAAEEDFVAVEVYRPGLGRLLAQAQARNLPNIRVSDEDACDLINAFEQAVFTKVYIFFPDPWPKKKHHKRRLLRGPFFEDLALRMHRHGRLFIATDCEHYAESILETLDTLPQWINLAGPARYALRPHFRPITKFEQKAQRAGSRVFDFALCRR